MNYELTKTNPIQTQFIAAQPLAKPVQSQPVVSLPAMPALSAAEGSEVEGVEPISNELNSVACKFAPGRV